MKFIQRRTSKAKPAFPNNYACIGIEFTALLIHFSQNTLFGSSFLRNLLKLNLSQTMCSDKNVLGDPYWAVFMNIEAKQAIKISFVLQIQSDVEIYQVFMHCLHFKVLIKIFFNEIDYPGWQPWSNMKIVLWHGMIMVIHTRHGVIMVISFHGHHNI